MDGAPYYLQVDALYFQARENGVHYGISNGKVLHPDFNSRFGGRLSAGINLNHDCWQVGLEVLHYHGRTRHEKSVGKFSSSWTHPQIANQTPFDHVYNMWRVHLGFGDLRLSRTWYLSHYLEFIPFVGLRYAEIRHKLRIYYRNDISTKNKFWGIGPVFGMEALWHWNSWLGIFSKGACSLNYGKFYVHQDEDVILRNSQFVFFNEFQQVRSIFDLSIGLDLRFCTKSCFEWSIRIGWELYLFPGQNQFARFTSTSYPGQFVANQGDLSLQGLSCGLGVSF